MFVASVAGPRTCRLSAAVRWRFLFIVFPRRLEELVPLEPVRMRGYCVYCAPGRWEGLYGGCRVYCSWEELGGRLQEVLRRPAVQAALQRALPPGQQSLSPPGRPALEGRAGSRGRCGGGSPDSSPDPSVVCRCVSVRLWRNQLNHTWEWQSVTVSPDGKDAWCGLPGGDRCNSVGSSW